MGILKSLRRRLERTGLPRRTQVEALREFHGSRYGGWTLCPDGLSPRSIVYSCGIGTDISFDISLCKRYGVQVFAFDPTPAALSWIRQRPLPPGYRFFDHGIAAYDGTARFEPGDYAWEASHSMVPGEGPASGGAEAPVCRLATLMERLGHAALDVLKLDVEGAEYDVIEDLVRCRLPVRQVLVEFHHRFAGICKEKTHQAIRSLNAAGYRIFHVSDTGREYSFLRCDLPAAASRS